jgi:hypothetical protein
MARSHIYIPQEHLACNPRYIATVLTNKNSYPRECVCVTQKLVAYQEFVFAGTCLPNRFLAMDVYTDFTVPAFGRHVTIC